MLSDILALLQSPAGFFFIAGLMIISIIVLAVTVTYFFEVSIEEIDRDEWEQNKDAH